MRMRIYLQIIVSIFFVLLHISCSHNDYDVILNQSDGTTKKFKCKNGKDTLNSHVYRYYDWVLVGEWSYKDGKKEGSVIDYHPNGNINLVTNYINDTAHGLNMVYNDSGNLIRRSFYLKNKQFLFESEMVNELMPDITRKTIVYKDENGKVNWAGELFINKDDEPTSVGHFHHISNTDTIPIDEYKGMYVNIEINDTLEVQPEYLVSLNITLPKTVYYPEILIGEFDKQLNCIDTICYSKPDSIVDNFTFKFQHQKSGNNYLIGRLNNTDIVKSDIYFFKGFYINPER